jgi:ArsR family transcriptional regulator
MTRAPEGIAAGGIACRLDRQQNTMSMHLSVLARAGLVTSKRHSQYVIYRASFEGAGTASGSC